MPWRRVVARVGAVATMVTGVAVGFDLEAQVPSADPPGVEIVETDGLRARVPSQLRIQSQPDLQIGVADGDPAYLFSRIAGIALLPDERIMVVDGASAELRYYDRQGRLIDRRGGRGQGPGEFQSPRLLNTVTGDSVVIYDNPAGRFTVYSSDGEGFRTFLLARGSGNPHATSGDRVLITSPAALPTPNAQGPLPTTFAIRLADSVRGTVDTVAVAPYTQIAITFPGSRLPSFVSAPFSVIPGTAADGGRFFIPSVDEPSVREYAWTGELRRVFRLREPVNRITEPVFSAAIESAVDRFVERSSAPRAAVRRSFDGVVPPDVAPSFQALIVDDEGWLWAQTYRASPDDPAPWLVFDSNGLGRGSVMMPEGLSVTTISHDYVAGVWRDDLDVEYVRLYRITGRS
jgi:hypothetical protein